MFHQEVGRRATLATNKAVADILRRRHHKRRVTIVVERTQTFVVHATLLECHELPHHVNNTGSIDNLVNRRSVYHSDLVLR